MTRQEANFQIPAGETAGNAPLQFNARLMTQEGQLQDRGQRARRATGKMGTARANVRVE